MKDVDCHFVVHFLWDSRVHQDDNGVEIINQRVRSLWNFRGRSKCAHLKNQKGLS